MLNLIRRDLILQKKQLWIFIPYILLFIYMDAPAMLVYVVACLYIPFNAHGFDERAETNLLLNSLPYTRTEIVASRYLGSVVFMAASVGLSSLAMWGFSKSFSWGDVALACLMFLLIAAFTFPLFHIIKPGYTTTAVLIGFVVSVLIFRNLAASLSEITAWITDFLEQFSLSGLYMTVTLTVALLYGLSWLLSTVIYKRKVF